MSKLFAKKEEEITTWDMLSVLWEEFDALVNETSTRVIDENVNSRDFLRGILLDRFPEVPYDWYYDTALGRFAFELTYVLREPNRDSIKWLHGEHALLYDIFGCSEHRVIIRMSDSCEEYIENGSVFCPKCNEENFRAPLDDYPYAWWEVSEEEWKSHISMAKFNKRFWRRYDRKHKLKELLRKISWT